MLDRRPLIGLELEQIVKADMFGVPLLARFAAPVLPILAVPVGLQAGALLVERLHAAENVERFVWCSVDEDPRLRAASKTAQTETSYCAVPQIVCILPFGKVAECAKLSVIFRCARIVIAEIFDSTLTARDGLTAP